MTAPYVHTAPPARSWAGRLAVAGLVVGVLAVGVPIVTAVAGAVEWSVRVRSVVRRG